MINYNDEVYAILTPEDFPRVAKELREYLEKKSEGSLLEYILDFCEGEYRVEEIAEIINADKELKTMLKQDCFLNKILKIVPKVEVEKLD
ncbi:MAG: hypothetical protein KAI79_01780 [Bacteroidales bacterium]|nr:hypothetical protein [Bacteroidales bacterium]